MLRKMFGCIGLVVVATSLVAAPQKQDTKKDGKSGKDAQDTKEVVAKVTKVDTEKKTISVTAEDGKKMDLDITDDVKIVGPRGGVSKERLKDDRMVVGAEVKVIYSANGKTLKEVRLPYRPREKDAATKAKAKDKAKAESKDKKTTDK